MDKKTVIFTIETTVDAMLKNQKSPRSSLGLFAFFNVYIAQSPLRKIGTIVPSCLMPSISILSEPIMKST